MTYTLTIVCLANSRKLSGRCIAGRVWSNERFGEWVRPVSDRPSEEISEEERRYEDGSDPRVLDIINIVMREPHAFQYQQENHLIDPQYYWEFAGRISWAELQDAVENPRGSLWTNGHSSYYGINDRVPEDIARRLTNSLHLVRPSGLWISVTREGASFGNPRRRVRARFDLNGQTYSLVVTDPVAERLYLSRDDGQYPVSEAALCVSLGELYQGFAYKLVATIITPDMDEKAA